MTSPQSTKALRFMAPQQRYAAYIRVAGARVINEAQANLREEARILRIALSCGDAWAVRNQARAA
jgi:hypothetical protein